MAQLAVQRCQAFQQEAHAVHAHRPGAEGAGAQQGRVEDVQRQHALGAQGGLHGRVVVESQVLFEPEQATHGEGPHWAGPFPGLSLCLYTL